MNKKIKKILIFIIFFILIIPYVKVQASTYELGDVNKDGNIDEEDVITLRNIITSKEESEVGDFNSDGSVDILDVIMLRKRIVNGSWEVKIAESQGKILNKNDNTTLVDEYGNEVVVPAGFAITKDASNVEDGIVITDSVDANGNSTGNEFVWIPVNDVKTSKGTKTVTLGRYSWNGNTGTPVQTVTTEAEAISAATTAVKIDSYFYEVTPGNAEYPQITYPNARAKDLEGFLKSSVKNGGYYIARYEAGIDGEKDNYSLSTKTAVNGTVRPQSKKGLGVWNSISQTNASILSQAMYTNDNFESDLINSYAWDTAIVFIQTMPNGNSTYASMSGRSAIDTSVPQITGTNILNETVKVDVQCNIYDMAGNVIEWSTETFSSSNNPCVYRGGYYVYSNYYTSSRSVGSVDADKVYGFRPLLYVGLDSDSETVE